MLSLTRLRKLLEQLRLEFAQKQEEATQAAASGADASHGNVALQKRLLVLLSGDILSISRMSLKASLQKPCAQDSIVVAHMAQNACSFTFTNTTAHICHDTQCAFWPHGSTVSRMLSIHVVSVSKGVCV